MSPCTLQLLAHLRVKTCRVPGRAVVASSMRGNA